MYKYKIFSFSLLFLGISLYASAYSYKAATGIGKKIESCEGVNQLYSDESKQLYKGVLFTEVDVVIENMRQHLFIVEVDLTKSSWTPSTPNFKNSLALKGEDKILPEHALAAEKSGKVVLAGTNGDFFGGNADPMGLFYKEGVELNKRVVAGHEAVLYMTCKGESYIGKANEALAYKTDLYHALGGFGTLVANGNVNNNINSELDEYLSGQTHPRVAVGLSKDRKKLYMLVADGRREGYAIGLSAIILAKLMKSMDCWNAINLDGGGSTTMILRNFQQGTLSFPVVNRPTDTTGPRKIANGLLIINSDFCKCK